MYCNKCGKFIEYEGCVCKECLQKEQTPNTYVEAEKNQAKDEKVETEDKKEIVVPSLSSKTQPKINMMAGFKTALFSAIIPDIALLVMAFTIEFFALAMVMNESGSPIARSIFGVVILLGFSIIVANVISMIMAISSVKFANEVSRRGGRKPIPAFICGIIGIVQSSAGLFVTTFIFVICSIGVWVQLVY